MSLNNPPKKNQRNPFVEHAGGITLCCTCIWSESTAGQITSHGILPSFTKQRLNAKLHQKKLHLRVLCIFSGLNFLILITELNGNRFLNMPIPPNFSFGPLLHRLPIRWFLQEYILLRNKPEMEHKINNQGPEFLFLR